MIKSKFIADLQQCMEAEIATFKDTAGHCQWDDWKQTVTE